MLDSIFQGLFDTDMTSVISVADFLLCLGASLLMGGILALSYAFRSRYTKASWLPCGCFLRWFVSLL